MTWTTRRALPFVVTTLLVAAAVSAAHATKRPLTITCPGNVTVTAGAAATSATVTYPPAVTSGGSGRVRVTYSQGSGTDFPIGTTAVTVSATDNTGVAVSCGFTVIVQAAAPVCTFAIAPTAASLPSTGGPTSVTVTASDPSCAWRAAPNVSWLTMSNTGLTGSGSVTVTSAANTGSTSQTGTATIAGQTFAVTEAAPAPAPAPTATLTASSTSLTAGQSVTLTLTTPTNNYHMVSLNGSLMTAAGCSPSTGPCTFTATATPSVTTTYQSSAIQADGTPYPNMPAITVTVTSPPPPPPSGGSLPTLVQASNLVDVGSFATPAGVMGACGSGSVDELTYANGSIAFNAANNSLFVVGHDWCQQTAELSIPAMGGAATVLQPFVDATAGRLSLIEPNSGTTNKIGGMFVAGSKLLMTGFVYYDGNGGAVASQFTRSTTLSDTSVTGPFTVGTMNPGFVAGFFTAVPPEWQGPLGGDLIVSQCCLSIITRTSFGPDAFVMKTADALAATSTIAATPLLYYDALHTTLGGWQPPAGTTDPTFNGTTQVHGSLIVPGTASLLFFGSTGLGTFCYGEGTSDPSLNNQPVPNEPGVVYCYDPSNSAKGQHAYPYTGYVWAYNLNDLAAVKAGTKNPWDVTPYATWPIPVSALGAAFDPATGRIFLSVPGSTLSVHVFKVQ